MMKQSSYCSYSSIAVQPAPHPVTTNRAAIFSRPKSTSFPGRGSAVSGLAWATSGQRGQTLGNVRMVGLYCVVYIGNDVISLHTHSSIHSYVFYHAKNQTKILVFFWFLVQTKAIKFKMNATYNLVQFSTKQSKNKKMNFN